MLFPPGVLGVDMFMVLSGFLIASALFKDHDRSQQIRYQKFYSRRAARILPALTVFLAVVWMIAGISPHLIPASSAWMATSGVLTFSLNLEMVWQCAYCDPLSSLWSLSLEEQFYFILPVCLSFLLRLRNKAAWVALLSLPILVSWLVRYPGCLSETPRDLCWQMSAAHGTPSRFMGQGIGVILATLYRFGIVDFDKPKVRRAAIWAVYLGVVYFVCAAVSKQITSCFGFDVICVGTAGLIVLAISVRPNPIQSFLKLKFLRFSGEISYGLYLWHGVCLWIAGQILPGPTYFRGTCGVIAAYLLAYLSFRFVETPVLRRVHGILRDRSESK